MIKKISEKIFCDVCRKSIDLTQQQFLYWRKGQRRFRCSKACSHDSKYRELRNIKKYCCCETCLKKGEVETTRIKIEEFSSKKLGNLARGDVQYKYLPGHGQTFKRKHQRVEKVCCYCEKPYVFNTNPLTPKLKQDGWCSQRCQMQQEKTQRVVQVIEDIKNFNIEIPPEKQFVRPPNWGKRKLEKYPVWCYSCGHTVMRKPLELFRRTLPLCKQCAPLAQSQLCFCGLPKYKTETKKTRSRDKYCRKHKTIQHRLLDYKERIEKWEKKISYQG